MLHQAKDIHLKAWRIFFDILFYRVAYPIYNCNLCNRYSPSSFWKLIIFNCVYSLEQLSCFCFNNNREEYYKKHFLSYKINDIFNNRDQIHALKKRKLHKNGIIHVAYCSVMSCIIDICSAVQLALAPYKSARYLKWTRVWSKEYSFKWKVIWN